MEPNGVRPLLSGGPQVNCLLFAASNFLNGLVYDYSMLDLLTPAIGICHFQIMGSIFSVLKERDQEVTC